MPTSPHLEPFGYLASCLVGQQAVPNCAVLWLLATPQELQQTSAGIPLLPGMRQQAFIYPGPCLLHTNLLHPVPHCFCFSFSYPVSLANVSYMWLKMQCLQKGFQKQCSFSHFKNEGGKVSKDSTALAMLFLQYFIYTQLKTTTAHGPQCIL